MGTITSVLHKLNSSLDKSETGRAVKRKLKYLLQNILREKAFWWHENALKNELEHFRGDPNRKIRVVFLIHIASSWTALKSIYETALKNENMEATVVLTPRRKNRFSEQWEGLDESETYFKSQNIKYIRSCSDDYSLWLDLKELNPDVVFIQTPYEDQRHGLYKIGRLNKFTRVCYVPYAFILTAGTFEQDFYGTYFHKDCWRIFAESDYHRKKFISFCDEKKVVVTGYPKFDVYKDLGRNQAQEYKKTILWAAHWTIGDEHFNASTFLKNYRYFIDLAKSNPDITVVFRPHPFLFRSLVDGGHFTQAQFDDFLASWMKLHNTEIDTNPNYFETFVRSDILVTDNGSFLGEYLPTENPIIYTHNYEDNGHNLSEYGINLIKYHYIAKDVEELRTLIDDVFFCGNDYLKEKRIQNARHLIFSSKDKAGELIVRSIVREFKGVHHST